MWRRASLLLAVTATLVAGCSSSSPNDHATTPCTPTNDSADGEINEVIAQDQRHLVLVGRDPSSSRVFMGTPDHLVEGRITSEEYVTCGDINVGFVVDGIKYSTVFPATICNGLGLMRIFAEGDDRSHIQQVTAVLPPTPANRLSFVCL